jgi:hypothetical protein
VGLDSVRFPAKFLKMTVNVPDRFKAANAFWIGLGKIELTPEQLACAGVWSDES